MNYFGSQAAAVRYDKGRPHFHANTIGHIKAYLHLDHTLDSALDIACGTGLSTKALLAIASNVFGTDLSEEMLKVAPAGDGITYYVAPAERQPFPDNKFDLVTVSSGVHWFNIDEFLAEANRLLKKDAFLIIYENAFPGKMEDQTDFARWNKEVYLRRFPSPPRNSTYQWTPANLEPKKMILSRTESFQNAVKFNRDELTAYLITQSNVIAAVESAKFTYAAIERWLKTELAVFFENDHARHVFYFNNWIKYLQKI